MVAGRGGILSLASYPSEKEEREVGEDEKRETGRAGREKGRGRPLNEELERPSQSFKGLQRTSKSFKELRRASKCFIKLQKASKIFINLQRRSKTFEELHPVPSLLPAFFFKRHKAS